MLYRYDTDPGPVTTELMKAIIIQQHIHQPQRCELFYVGKLPPAVDRNHLEDSAVASVVSVRLFYDCQELPYLVHYK